MDLWFPEEGGPAGIEWGGCAGQPNVLRANKQVDPEVYSSLAFSMGIERTLMLSRASLTCATSSRETFVSPSSSASMEGETDRPMVPLSSAGRPRRRR